MTRQALEHILRASAHIADDRDIVVIGSQAILGPFPDAPPAMLLSHDADVYPRNHPGRAELIDGSIGELSPFHQTFGYYAHGVGPETATLPEGWQERLVELAGPGTAGATGWCVEPHDLVVSKHVAARDKDRDYGRVAVQAGLVEPATLLRRLEVTPITPERRVVIARLVRQDAAG